MQGMAELMQNDISTVIKNVLDMIDGNPEFLRVKKLLSPYADKSGEAFQGIELALRQSLEIFASQTTHFFLDINPQKASPLDLEKKISIFFPFRRYL